MKLTSNSAFSIPIICETELDTEQTVEMIIDKKEVGDKTEFIFNSTINSEFYKEKIENGSIVEIVNIECSKPFKRETINLKENKGFITETSKLESKHEITYFLVTKNLIILSGKDFFYDDRTTYTVNKNTILGYNVTNIEHVILEKSMIELFEFKKNDKNHIEYTYSDNMIIELPEKTYKFMELNKSNNEMDVFVLNAIVVPALIDAMWRLVNNDEEAKFFESFEHILKSKNIDLSNRDLIPHFAYKILDYTINGMGASYERLKDNINE